ncbi:hypothetical protein SAY87_003393 [Trapa incisa]|uniref:Uncharacterized protein n=1 Tax=Trapa incisa TaxID=236973 RepID=A0AAN7KKT1_9MYRT|nr:hypothetical protein SAY87_003393 [Trapa incisa]
MTKRMYLLSAVKWVGWAPEDQPSSGRSSSENLEAIFWLLFGLHCVYPVHLQKHAGSMAGADLPIFNWYSAGFLCKFSVHHSYPGALFVIKAHAHISPFFASFQPSLLQEKGKLIF